MPNGPALILGPRVFPISRRTLLVGRGDHATNHVPDVDLAELDEDRVVSRRHARIEYRDGPTVLVDLGSTNGTFVNGHRLDRDVECVLAEGDLVRFGHLECRFQELVAWPTAADAPSDTGTLIADSMVLRALGGLAQERPAEANRIEQIERVHGIIREGRVSMVFQPIVELTTGRPVGVESLARIIADPLRTPDKWFEEAHGVGLGIQLELVAMQAAMDQLGLLAEGLYMSINASPATVVSQHLAPLLRGRPLSRLVLEVTEHDAVSDYEGLTGALAGFRQEGLRLAVDDMGSGYSNMKHILRLAPDVIKLDVDLVRGLDADPARRALASSLSAFARDIGAKIVAEGVENERERAVLVDLGVPLGQGYHFARPGQLPL